MKSETVLQRKKKLSSLLERLEPWIYIAAAVIGIAAVVLVGLVDFSMIRDYELALSIGFVLWACSLSICFLGMSKVWRKRNNKGCRAIIRDKLHYRRCCGSHQPRRHILSCVYCLRNLLDCSRFGFLDE